MKSKIIIAGLLFLPLLVGAQKYKGDSWAQVKAAGSGTLTVVYYEQAGLIQDVAGKPQGLCVDVLNDFVAFVQTKYQKKLTIQFAGKEPVFSEFLSETQKSTNVLGVTNKPSWSSLIL